MNTKLFFTIILSHLFCTFAYGDVINLKDNQCVSSGPKEGKELQTLEGYKSKYRCELKKQSLNCSIYDLKSGKFKSSVDFLITRKTYKRDNIDYIYGTNNDGNLKINVNFRSKKFQWGQVILTKPFGDTIITKFCMGQIL